MWIYTACWSWNPTAYHSAKLGAGSACGLTQPTPADTFLLREKYPKAYQRGSILFDISSGGSLPHSHSVTFPLVYYESFMLHWGNSPFCWRSRNQEVPCESLVPFFSQERNCQCGRHEPTKLKLYFTLNLEVKQYQIPSSSLTSYVRLAIIERKRVYVVCPTSELFLPQLKLLKCSSLHQVMF